MTEKSTCVVCEIVNGAPDVPAEHKIVMAFEFGRAGTRHSTKEPPMCEEHEVLTAAMRAMVETVIKRTGSLTGSVTPGKP